jgi:Tol biopolymer transport system component
VFSPDGKWIAYSSAATTNDLATIYVQPYPPTGERHQIERTLSSDQPHHPVWASQGSELIFNQRAGLLTVVSVTTSPTFRFGNPVNAPRRFQTGSPSQRRAFDIMGDGRIVGIIAAGSDRSVSDDTQINVVMNWFEELKARMSARR